MDNSLRAITAAISIVAATGVGSRDFNTIVHFAVTMVAAHATVSAAEWARTASTSAWRTKQRRWMWAFGGIALLFNPFLPVVLDRDTWAVLELGVGLLLGERVAREVRNNYRASKRQPQREASA